MIGCFANLGDYDDLLKTVIFLKVALAGYLLPSMPCLSFVFFPGVASAVLSIMLVYK